MFEARTLHVVSSTPYNIRLVKSNRVHTRRAKIGTADLDWIIGQYTR